MFDVYIIQDFERFRTDDQYHGFVVFENLTRAQAYELMVIAMNHNKGFECFPSE